MDLITLQSIMVQSIKSVMLALPKKAYITLIQPGKLLLNSMLIVNLHQVLLLLRLQILLGMMPTVNTDPHGDLVANSFPYIVGIVAIVIVLMVALRVYLKRRKGKP